MDQLSTHDKPAVVDRQPQVEVPSGWRLVLADHAADGWPAWLWAVVPVSFGVFVALISGAIGGFPALVVWSLALAGGIGLYAAQAAGRDALAAHPRAGRDWASRDSQWRRLVDALPEATLVLDEDGNVLHHNAAVADLFQNVRIGQPLSRTIRNPDLLAAIDRAADEEATNVVPLIERIPVERRIAATVTRLLPAGEHSRAGPALLVTFRDLSEQDKLTQMREDFVANASHELRTPLASLKGFLETLQGPARDDPAARERFLGLMASQAERMNRLIDDLLSLSRVEMRAHLPPRGIVDLNEIAIYISQTLEPVARSAGAVIEVEIVDTAARIRGDRDQLVQVFSNLVQNAIVHGGRSPNVKIRVSRSVPPGRFIVSVSDDGPGIAPEHLPRLTERFYRANVASSRAKGGTGLGLAIVKHIVARHRGELEIVSKLGSGSTFSVVLDELRSSGGGISSASQ